MRSAMVTPIHSPQFLELQTTFGTFKPPYGKGDIVRFNLLYQRIYNQLNREEKRRAEEFVDALIANVESQELASRIFGVV